VIAVDATVLLRLLTRDDAGQAGKAERVIAAAEAEGESVLVNDAVLAETMWTLARSFDASKPELLHTVRSLLATKTFAFESRPVVAHALELYEGSSADFADCVIVAKNAALGCVATLTFDRAMRGLPATRLL
jgi:predicted nucleic-acid-binding protein